MGFFVPETMKKMNNWLLQRGKVPYSPITRQKTSPASPEGWASYEEAATVLQYGDFDGLGFGLLASDRLTFVDLDHCIDEDGVLSDLAEEVLAMFPDTYTEVSQSETGLHIICRGTVPQAVKRPEIEMYSCGRYMAFTGNAWTAAEPAEHQKEIDLLFSRYGKKPEAETKPNKAAPATTPKKPQNAHRATETATVGEIIDCILKSRQGAKFARLHAGQWEGGNYKSQSEAEMAYFAIVNYFTGGNDDLTAAVFAASKLSERKKGQRADYIQRTISKAKATATGSKKQNSSRKLKPIPNSEAGSGNKKKIIVKQSS